jgi:homopolymeric O-antigen transport system permease protein
MANSTLVDRAAERRSVASGAALLFAYRELVRNLVVKELSLKYRGSVLGFLWSLVNPIATVAVYTFAFKYILNVRQPGFSVFVLLGVLAWSFFANSAVMATGALIDGASLLKVVRFPSAVLPLATVLFNLAQHLLTICTFFPLMFLLYRVPPAGPVLVYPIFLALQVLFTAGMSFMLAAATAYFRDVRHFVDIGLSLMFWTTPIVYPLSQIPQSLRWLLLASPMSPFVVAYQSIFYYGDWPSAAVWLGAATYGLGVFFLGFWWYQSIEDRLGEQLA